MSLVWGNRIKVCRPAKAQQTGPNRSKMIFKRDFTSKNPPKMTLKGDYSSVDAEYRDKKHEFNRLIQIIRGE